MRRISAHSCEFFFTSVKYYFILYFSFQNKNRKRLSKLTSNFSFPTKEPDFVENSDLTKSGLLAGLSQKLRPESFSFYGQIKSKNSDLPKSSLLAWLSQEKRLKSFSFYGQIRSKNSDLPRSSLLAGFSQEIRPESLRYCG